ncbi:MAG: hypothetical protein K6V73_03760 [Firmicutes bacterium]|nr:hypothetical protein [Bacillota bacterium]
MPQASETPVAQGLEAAIRRMVAEELRQAIATLGQGPGGPTGGGGGAPGPAGSGGAPDGQASAGTSQGAAAIRALMWAAQGPSPADQGKGQGQANGQAGAQGASARTGGEGGGGQGTGTQSRPPLARGTGAAGARRVVGRLRPGGGGADAAQVGARRAPAGAGGAATAEGMALLAQAQEAFAQELRDNLEKLRRVIGESQQIARKMEAVLGQQGGGGGGGGS